jgi:XXXCH domain-containing protein
MKMPKRKLKKKVKATELGSYMRSVADAIEGQSDNNHEELTGLFDDFSKASIELKRKSIKATIEIKVKTELEPMVKTQKEAPDPSYAPSPSQNNKLKYKDLKKRMKKSFKAINEFVSGSRLPERSDLESFLNDSELMVSYPGNGDEHYPAFRKACQSLNNAFIRLDFASFKQQFEEIKTFYRDCHDRYK